MGSDLLAIWLGTAGVFAGIGVVIIAPNVTSFWGQVMGWTMIALGVSIALTAVAIWLFKSVIRLRITQIDTMPGGGITLHVRVSNAGAPTTLHGWILTIRTAMGKTIRIDHWKSYGLDAEGDLFVKPLESGGTRYGIFETEFHRDDQESVEASETRYVLQAMDITDRKVSTTFKVRPVK